MTLALVRHGRTLWNLDRRMQGHSDIELDEVGRAQAEAAGEILARGGWTRVVSSPLRRAAQTADIIRGFLPSASFVVHPDLRERDYGDAEGLPVDEVHDRWPNGDYPASETVSAAAQRSAAVLKDLASNTGNSIVVAHGTILRLAIEALTGKNCPRILNGEVILLEGEPGGGFVSRRDPQMPEA